MFTLEQLLRSKFGFTDAEFSPSGLLSVDSQAATLSACTRNMIVRLRDIFEVGQEIDIIPTPSSRRHARFCILQISEDGLRGIAPDGRTGFLPWEMLSYGISHPALVTISMDADERFPDSAINSSRTYYEELLASKRAAVTETENWIHGIDDRRRSH